MIVIMMAITPSLKASSRPFSMIDAAGWTRRSKAVNLPRHGIPPLPLAARAPRSVSRISRHRVGRALLRPTLPLRVHLPGGRAGRAFLVDRAPEAGALPRGLPSVRSGKGREDDRRAA